MFDNLLTELIDFVKTASPLLWETLIRQVYVQAIATIAWSIGCIIACIVLIKVAKYGHAKCEEDEYSSWSAGEILGWTFAGMFGITAFGLAVSAATYFMNPNYYAIRLILGQIK